jgi:O-methyltransferase
MSARPVVGPEREDVLRASLAGIREARARQPAPEAGALRAAYLELLKLCLTDLVATTTVSVGPTTEGGAVAREILGDERRMRAAGLDWPLQGLTMGGLARLDDLQACVDSLVRDGVPGDLIEAGAWRGGSSILMRAALDALEDAAERTVWVADSFEGFRAPEDEGEDRGGLNTQLSAFEILSVPVGEVEENFRRLGLEQGVRFVKGYFEETLPPLRGEHRWALIRLDGDTYEATRTALDALYEDLAPGGYVIVDDYGAVDLCAKAVDDFRREHGIDDPLETVDWTCARWRRDSGPGGAFSAVPAVQLDPRPETGHPKRPLPGLRVPTITEYGLRLEIDELKGRLERERERCDRRGELLRALSDSGAVGLAAGLSRLRNRGRPAVGREDVRRALADDGPAT